MRDKPHKTPKGAWIAEKHDTILTKCSRRRQTSRQCRHLANWMKHAWHLWFWPISSIIWKHDVKPEVYKLSHCHQRKTTPQPRYKKLVKFGCVVFRYVSRQTNKQKTNRQTFRHADHNTLHPYRRQSNQKYFGDQLAAATPVKSTFNKTEE